MACADYDSLIVRRAGNGLTAEESTALDAHLAACPACRDNAELIGGGDEPPPRPLPRVDGAAFDKLRVLGVGGMGTTYLAWDLRLERAVALKEPNAETGAAAELAARFENEARMTAQLQHPAIVPIYEAGVLVDGDGERPFYTMRPIDGLELELEIARRPALRERLALLPHLTTIANAVAYAHDRGIVHRDIKPANILVGTFGDAVLIDWGLAKQIHERDGAGIATGRLTRAGIGTANYMPPEQARGAAADPRADVYALGATLYHLLAGQAPYAGVPADAVRAGLRADAPDPLDLADAVPAELRSIMRRAMRPIPGDRFATARELADELTRFQAGQLVRSHAHTPRELLRRWLGRHRAIVATVAIALLVLAIGAGLSVSRIVSEREAAIAAEARARTESAVAAEAARGRLAAEQTALAAERARSTAIADMSLEVFKTLAHPDLELGFSPDAIAALVRALSTFDHEQHGLSFQLHAYLSQRCVAGYDRWDDPVSAPDDLPLARCRFYPVTEEYSIAIAERLGDQIRAPLATAGIDDVLVVPHLVGWAHDGSADPDAIVAFPTSGTAADWNRAAQRNTRVEIQFSR